MIPSVRSGDPDNIEARAANLAKTDFPDCIILDIQSMTYLLN
jgi:hypothetical protein